MHLNHTQGNQLPLSVTIWASCVVLLCISVVFDKFPYIFMLFMQAAYTHVHVHCQKLCTHAFCNLKI